MKLFERTRRSSRRLAILLATAFCVRLAAVAVCTSSEARPTTYEHGAIADNLLAGRGFSVWFLGSEGPTSQQAPWVPGLLALCSLPFGHVTSASILLFQLLQCAAGTATVWAAFRLVEKWFPERSSVAWLVGVAATLFPPHVYAVTHVQAAVWSTLGVTGLFALAAETSLRPTTRGAAALGFVAGWLLLVDPILVLLLPIVFGMSFFAQSSPAAAVQNRAAWRRLGLACGSLLVVLGPWLLRNYAVHGEFVFVKSTFGYAFWQGNNPRSFGTDKIPKPESLQIAADHDGSLVAQHRAIWEARHETLYIDDVLLKPDGYRQFQGLGEPARSRLLGRRARLWVEEHPTAYLRLCLNRLRNFFLWDETNPKALHPIYRITSSVWLTLAAIGLLAARKDWGRLAPSLLAFFGIAAFHIATITSARFRLPIEPLSLIWIAVGFAPSLEHIGRRLLRAWQAARNEPSQATQHEPSPTVSRRRPLSGPPSRSSQTMSRPIFRRR